MVTFSFACMQHAIKWKLGLIKIDFFRHFFLFVSSNKRFTFPMRMHSTQQNGMKGTFFAFNQFWLKAFNTWSNFVCLNLEFGFSSHINIGERKLSKRRDCFFSMFCSNHISISFNFESALAWLHLFIPQPSRGKQTTKKKTFSPWDTKHKYETLQSWITDYFGL